MTSLRAPARLLGGLVPAVAATAEAFADVDAAVFAEEAALVARAVAKRRREFATTRACARRALAALGLPPAPIGTGERGAPAWPPGVVGSLTHCEGYRAAVVAWERDLGGVGVDAEPDAPLPPGVLDAIALPGERAMVSELTTGGPGPSWDRLLFSAKEAVYKAWFPLARTMLGFDQAGIEIDAARRTFTARLRVPGPVARLTGRWLAADGLVVTAVTVPAGSPGRAGR